MEKVAYVLMHNDGVIAVYLDKEKGYAEADRLQEKRGGPMSYYRIEEVNLIE